MYMLERHYEEITKGMPDRTQLQAVNITNAATWFFEDPSKDEYDLRDDFPIVTPPFDVMWMEFLAPKRAMKNGKFVDLKRTIESIGCIVGRISIPHEERVSVLENDLILRIASAPQRSPTAILPSDTERKARNTDAVNAGREARWLVVWKFYARTNSYVDVATGRSLRGGDLVHMANVFAYIDYDGALIPENYLFAMARWASSHTRGEVPFGPVLFATSLMHAKNVQMIDSPLPPAVLKRRQKDGKPAITFKTLVIQSMRKQAKEATEGGDTSAKRAMHIVRGHFKDYRNSGGLFGKHRGLYWWDMHVAGNDKFGKVIKDYQV